jgi:ABC-type nickel/cobalt efflux system permease component RcnA
MKKADLLHTTILILAILAGYSAMEGVLYFLTYVTYATDSTASTGLLLYRLFPALLFAVACVLLIRNGRKYTAALLKVADAKDTEEAEDEEEEEETVTIPETEASAAQAAKTTLETMPVFKAVGDADIKWQLDRRNIVFALIIGIGLYTLIQAAPYIIVHLFELFRNRVGSDTFRQGSPAKTNLIIQLLQATIGAFLVYAAPTLTNFIDKTIAVRLDSTSQTET